MKKEKIYEAVFGIGLLGMMLHPVFIIALVIGVIGLNRHHDTATDEQI